MTAHTPCDCIAKMKMGKLNRMDAEIVYCPLHAATPELLAALRGLLDMVTDNRTHGEEVDHAVRAIAAAEGSK